MELRHIRYFVAVAEELHFARAAGRLHIEQSPLSRAIKDLEYDLGAQLLERTTRHTSLTWAGEVFLDEARRILASVNRAKAAVKSAAMGYRGHLRIALSDGIAQPRLATLLARCRVEDPEVEIRIIVVPISQQLKYLRNNLLDAGFALTSEVGDGLTADPVWTDPVVVAVPARHPLLAHKSIALEDALQYPLILCHPEVCSGFYQQVEAFLRAVDIRPIVADQVASLEVVLTLVGAGYGIGFAMESQMGNFQRPDVVVRPLAGPAPVMTTYLLRTETEPSAPLTRFIDRLGLPDPNGSFSGPPAPCA